METNDFSFTARDEYYNLKFIKKLFKQIPEISSIFVIRGKWRRSYTNRAEIQTRILFNIELNNSTTSRSIHFSMRTKLMIVVLE